MEYSRQLASALLLLSYSAQEHQLAVPEISNNRIEGGDSGHPLCHDVHGSLLELQVWGPSISET